ncbi:MULTISPECIES: hypothetical protein [Mucilaginibacter]|nr:MULTISPECIES: hypothetical protein [Mucilaginibacter]
MPNKLKATNEPGYNPARFYKAYRSVQAVSFQDNYTITLKPVK